MRRRELKAILEQIGISQADLADLVKVTTRAVNLWMTGSRSIPGPLAAYVRLLASLPMGMQQAELARLQERAKTMKDGMYLIEYAGQASSGYGTLIFDSGRIYGVDVAAGKYDGEYQFNEASGLVDVKIRVQMPAGQPSVIGVVHPFDWILEVTTTIDPDKDSGRLNVQTNLGRPIVANYRFVRTIPVAA